jgi:hypothetical protein
MSPVVTVLSLEAAQFEDKPISKGDILRFVQAPTENARFEVGATVTVAEVKKDPQHRDGFLDVEVSILDSAEARRATVEILVAAKRGDTDKPPMLGA